MINAQYGGTGLTTITDGAVMLGSGTGNITPLAVTTDGAIIIGDGSTDPTTLSAFSSATGTLKVANGGTSASTLTDGGILLGSGTNAITALGVATNGQIPIGDNSTDPQLATITGTANEITVTNGAGTITLDIPNAVTLNTLTLTNPLAVANGGTNQTTTGLAFGGNAVTYSGNSTDNRTVAHGLGRAPILALISKNVNPAPPVIWISGMPAGDDKTFLGVTSVIGIKGVDGTNITLGTSSDVNETGATHRMFVI